MKLTERQKAELVYGLSLARISNHRHAIESDGNTGNDVRFSTAQAEDDILIEAIIEDKLILMDPEPQPKYKVGERYRLNDLRVDVEVERSDSKAITVRVIGGAYQDRIGEKYCVFIGEKMERELVKI